LGLRVRHRHFFDTVRVEGSADDVARWVEAATRKRVNLRRLSDTALAVALDETTTPADVALLLGLFGPAGAGGDAAAPAKLAAEVALPGPAEAARTSAYLTHPVFNRHHSETEMLRYMRRL